MTRWGRVFSRLDATGFEEGFWDWVQGTFELTNGQVVPINGKSVRGSHDQGRSLVIPIRYACET